MFNSDVSLAHLIKPNLVALQPLQNEYGEKFSNKSVEVDGGVFLHLSDISTDRIMKRKMQRAVEKLPSDAIKDVTECLVHPKKTCKLIDFQYGFLCFLHSMTSAESVPQVEDGQSVAVDEEMGAEEEVHEESASIDLEHERMEAEQQLFPAFSSFDDVDTQSRNSMEGDDQIPGELALPQLPFFSMHDGFHYVLMSDVTHHFNIREDYCLAALAQFCQADHDFVEHICDKYLLIDSNCDEASYQGGRDILEKILAEAKRYERALPLAEEFDEALRRLGLEHMGRESIEPPNVDTGVSSISLWTASLLEDDENQQVGTIHLNALVCFT